MYRQAAAVHKLGLDRAGLVVLMGNTCKRREAALPVRFRQFSAEIAEKSVEEFGEFMAEKVKEKVKAGEFRRLQVTNLLAHRKKGGYRLRNTLRKSFAGTDNFNIIFITNLTNEQATYEIAAFAYPAIVLNRIAVLHIMRAPCSYARHADRHAHFFSIFRIFFRRRTMQTQAKVIIS